MLTYATFNYIFTNSPIPHEISNCHYCNIILFISIPLIPYSCGVEVFHFSLDLYTIGRTPWTSDQPVARPLPKYRTAQRKINTTHTHETSVP
jgi:hypothetical protein